LEQKTVLQLPSLSQVQKDAVEDNGKHIRRHYLHDLPAHHGLSGKYMDPHYVVNPARSQHASASSLCFPYFYVAKYDGSKSSVGKSLLHPMRPLMKSYSASAKKEHDVDQAISVFPDTPKDHCIHVAQLWALIIDKGG